MDKNTLEKASYLDNSIESLKDALAELTKEKENGAPNIFEIADLEQSFRRRGLIPNVFDDLAIELKNLYLTRLKEVLDELQKEFNDL